MTWRAREPVCVISFPDLCYDATIVWMEHTEAKCTILLVCFQAFHSICLSLHHQFEVPEFVKIINEALLKYHDYLCIPAFTMTYHFAQNAATSSQV